MPLKKGGDYVGNIWRMDEFEYYISFVDFKGCDFCWRFLENLANEVQLMIDWVTNGYIHDTAMLIQLV